MPSAARIRFAKFRITAVTFVALVIMAVLFWLLTGGTLLKQKVPLYLYIDDATGLSPGSSVSVNGVDVGKVKSVALSGSRVPNRTVRVVLDVETDYLPSIPIDSTTDISTENPVGDKFVDITRGKSGTYVQPGSELIYKPSPELLKTIDLAQFDQQLRATDAFLSDIEQGRNFVGQLILKDDFYNQLRGRVAGLERIIRTAAQSTNEVGKITYTDELYRSIQAPLLELDDMLSHIQAGQGAFGGWLRDDAAYAQLVHQMDDLRRSFADMHSGTLFQTDDLYTSWNRALGSMIQSVDDFNSTPLLTTSDVYDNLNGFTKELRDTLSDFRRSPQKYLRFKMFGKGPAAP
jgi:phospholipid/cholesterol/gamma-HCH transport system substrate-binding protein